MANKKISELPAATVPLDDADLFEIVQGGVNKKVAKSDVSSGGSVGLDGHSIEDEGTPFTQRGKLNFVGAGVTVTDDSGDGATVVTIPGSGDVYLETEDVTGTTYNFSAGDHSKVKRFTNAAGCTATVPTGLTIGWNTNVYRGEGAGVLTIASAGSLESIATQLTEEKTMATIFVRDTDIHVAVGALGAPSGGGHTIEDEGTPLTQRTKLNFVGAGVTVTDDSGDDASVVTINGTSYTAETFGDFIIALAGKTTPVNADSIVISDSEATGDAKEVTFTDLKAFLKTYFDSLYTVTVGVQDLYIPASAMWPKTTEGCATLAKTEVATSLVNIQTLDFNQTSNEHAQFTIVLPRKYNNGTITAVFYWTAASGSGTVRWGISGGAYSNDDALSTALGTEVTVDDTLITANDVHITSATSAVTLAGTPADGDFIAFQISRSPGSDTLDADAKLLGVSLRITTDAGTDA